VDAAIQPGRLRACPPDEGFCTGTVETVTYVGTLVRVGLRLAGLDKLLRIEAPAGWAPIVGERIGVKADAQDVNLFGTEGR
jgi:putative spermidine/putrescine transport system ATP-binding protein/mannopine transport system ATP-binding protein